ncbi:unnamed protein product [Porites lobata]|uniref:SAP domain-containing protein n=1 Tax=Porites lobata TaxID=104759 RepID=A0ABN8PK62_9CNID|nr:unnamed protein product [Porites lobata]
MADIPGAELPRQAEHCTVAILKRWLACSGAKVPGKREDLIKSVLSHNLVDPDGGINLRKKRLELSLEQDISPSIDVAFPQDGFEVGISSVPKVGFGQIWKYLMEEVEFKKQLSVEKRILKGYNFFKSGKVLGLYSKTENGLLYLKSQVFIFKDWADVYYKKSILPMSSWE